MLRHWVLPVHLAWGKTMYLPIPAQLREEFSIPEWRLGEGVYLQQPPSLPPLARHWSSLRRRLPQFSPGRCRAKNSWEGELPGGNQGSWTTLTEACTLLPRGATLLAAMPLPLACCQDEEDVAVAQDGGPAQLAFGILRATRIPGLHYMCTRPQSRLRRLLWSLAFLASAGLLATGATDRLQHLLSHPVHTRARLAWAPQLRFPAVTLCNPNRARFLHLTKPDLYSVGQWLGLAWENRSLVPEMLAVLGEDRRVWLMRLANYSRFLPPRRSERTMQSFFHRLGHQIEDMLVECRFQGERCGPQHFIPVSPCLVGAGWLGCPTGAGE
ncbi:acid-sensing ion channel 1-like [Cuculus canorus]|uniref:acid-sensing ion channel 1-like n=1 Tax=Cuculus canorus TaxID=55661 RepID=UPI0023AAE2FD|nr:acid-sensing ion channel 1-like [Cuculus canorus]